VENRPGGGGTVGAGIAVRSDAVQKWLVKEGLEPAGGPPEEFRGRIRNDVEKWRRVVKAANIVIAR